jgi:hypothetical protein
VDKICLATVPLFRKNLQEVLRRTNRLLSFDAIWTTEKTTRLATGGSARNVAPKMRPHSQTHKWSWNEQKFGHGSRRAPENKNDCAVEGQQQFTVMLCYATGTQTAR